ncbi:protein PLASTID REDOX INSENSITIVE 2, chloroplastic-like [Euphorbia lathyris]|uniref:protein PLASTID REDOX INSENSITIVE 2, chloroplastic-like n=1 Tax=Euphorbia lathyris TaxID=212925 RepID=UPI00331424D4
MALLYKIPVSILSVSPAKISIFTPPILSIPSLILHPPPVSLTILCSIPKFRATSTTTPNKYIYPDPIPEFAHSETLKFRAELLKKLSLERETFGDDLVRVVDVCAEIFSDFMHKEYGGPGTLLVEPFTDMLVALKEKKLPGAPLAAREALLWAQNYVDQDWQFWHSTPT